MEIDKDKAMVDVVRHARNLWAIWSVLDAGRGRQAGCGDIFSGDSQ